MRRASVRAAVVIVVVALALNGAGNAGAKTPPGLVLTVTTTDLPKTRSAIVRILQSTFPPGFDSGWHAHPSPPFVYVVSGNPTWEYRDGRKPATRHAGEAMMEPKNVVMRLRNRGTTPMQLVLFQASRPGEPLLHPAH